MLSQYSFRPPFSWLRFYTVFTECWFFIADNIRDIKKDIISNGIIFKLITRITLIWGLPEVACWLRWYWTGGCYWGGGLSGSLPVGDDGGEARGECASPIVGTYLAFEVAELRGSLILFFHILSFSLFPLFPFSLLPLPLLHFSIFHFPFSCFFSPFPPYFFPCPFSLVPFSFFLFLPFFLARDSDKRSE